MAELFTWNLLFKIICAGVASVAFAMLLKIGRRHLLHASIGAMLTYLIYAIANATVSSLFVAAFISSLFTGLYAEIFARIRRAPTIVFTLTGVIPTVPGGNLYHAMRELITNDFELALSNFIDTAQIGLGIAGGIVAMSVLFGIGFDIYKRVRARIEK